MLAAARCVCLRLWLGRLPFLICIIHRRCRRYLYDADLKQDPAAYKHIYEELKVEAALLVVVRPPFYRLK